jgi:hypothetical protein
MSSPAPDPSRRGALDIRPHVASMGVSAALVTLALWAVHATTGQSPSAEHAAALVTAVGFGAGYLTPGR